MIYVLSTDSKTSTSSILYRIYAAWNDLNYLKTEQDKKIEFISLFDDRYKVWTAKKLFAAMERADELEQVTMESQSLEELCRELDIEQ